MTLGFSVICEALSCLLWASLGEMLGSLRGIKLEPGRPASRSVNHPSPNGSFPVLGSDPSTGKKE